MHGIGQDQDLSEDPSQQLGDEIARQEKEYGRKLWNEIKGKARSSGDKMEVDKEDNEEDGKGSIRANINRLRTADGGVIDSKEGKGTEASKRKADVELK